MEEHREDVELGPTYKTLFLGACLIIGGAFGWWLTNFVASIDAYHKDITERLAKLESRAITSEESAKYRDAKLDDHEERIRRIDRRP